MRRHTERRAYIKVFDGRSQPIEQRYQFVQRVAENEPSGAVLPNRQTSWLACRATNHNIFVCSRNLNHSRKQPHNFSEVIDQPARAVSTKHLQNPHQLKTHPISQVYQLAEQKGKRWTSQRPCSDGHDGKAGRKGG